MGSMSVSPSQGIFLTDVVENTLLCPDHYLLTLAAPGFPAAECGQFVQVQCGSPAGDPVAESLYDPTRVPIVRRPFSLAGARTIAGGMELRILYRVLGPGTAWMGQRRVGDRVSVAGPLGRPFTVDRKAELSLLVGGGTGLPPMMWLGRLMAEAGQRAFGICGARTQTLLPMTFGGTARADVGFANVMRVAEFGETPVVVTTDDGSLGLNGTVLDGIAAVRRAAGVSPERTAIYACGPEGMLRAVAELAAREGIACQVCLERMMACGMGTCQSCVVQTRDEQSSRGWRYQLCCQDGPVFDSRIVMW
jgi:dihydroorotate dehydrogenase electron transfer subunit